MPQRLAAVMSLLAFALCLVIGGMQADNTFVTSVWRALVAMAGTFVVALVVGLMAQRMLEENVTNATTTTTGPGLANATSEKSKIAPAELKAEDR